jgi:hypothetical protein
LHGALAGSATAFDLGRQTGSQSVIERLLPNWRRFLRRTGAWLLSVTLQDLQSRQMERQIEYLRALLSLAPKPADAQTVSSERIPAHAGRVRAMGNAALIAELIARAVAALTRLEQVCLVGAGHA